MWRWREPYVRLMLRWGCVEFVDRLSIRTMDIALDRTPYAEHPTTVLMLWWCPKRVLCLLSFLPFYWGKKGALVMPREFSLIKWCINKKETNKNKTNTMPLSAFLSRKKNEQVATLVAPFCLFIQCLQTFKRKIKPTALGFTKTRTN